MAVSKPALVIVESPTKARTIRQYLGSGFRVEASMGHVRDLPSNADEIPEEVRGKSWARIGVDVEQGFAPVYIVPDDKKKVVAELKKALKEAGELYVATDEDREGESIGWHLVQVLKPTVPTRRMVFHEITPEAIREALTHTRALDEKRVTAQEARRVLDRLVGYVVSPLLWKKVAPKLSAGRVQSVAVRLLVLRERERLAFASSRYWDLVARLHKAGTAFDATLAAVDGRRVASGRDFDETTGQLANPDVVLLDAPAAESLRARLDQRPAHVASVERRLATKTPYPPFTTSTLQQEANRKLGFGAGLTMQLAQRLYENGHITYMRTDSTALSEQAVGGIRGAISGRYGDAFLSRQPRQYETRSKGAQEAHEAIRPAGTRMGTADELGLHGPEARLYDLIWKRAMATQMADAQLAYTNAEFVIVAQDGTRGTFKSSGREVIFPGFLRAYVEGSDDPDEALDDQSSPLPTLQRDEQIANQALKALGHETRPPARYTEATLIRALEREGIGRPSTYATILDTIQRRGYVNNKARQLIPTFTAMAVTGLLEQTHAHVVDSEFTAAMEERLDAIGEKSDAEDFLRTFYQRELLGGVKNADSLDPRTVCTLVHPRFAPYTVRIGKFGAYIELRREGQEKPDTISLPDDAAPADLSPEYIRELLERSATQSAPLGLHPTSGEPIFLLTGRFGPYLQLGDATDKAAKPKRVSVPRGTDAADVSLDRAVALLDLPRTLGDHPETGKTVVAGVGQYGPYVLHNRVYASLPKGTDVLDVDLEQAVSLLAQKANRSRGPQPIRELGRHPADGEPVALFEGRFGAYVKHNEVNATIPRDKTAAAVTLEEAIQWLAARADAPAGSKKRAGGARTRRAGGKAAAVASTEPKRTVRKGTSAKAKVAKATADRKSAAKPRPAATTAAGEGSDATPKRRTTAARKSTTAGKGKPRTTAGANAATPTRKRNSGG